MSRRLPLFPLGTVLMPTHVVPLHIFEPRYRVLMDDLTGAELGTPLIEPEFGVVLIERGREVGGGETRARTGTVARLVDAQRLPDGRWVVAANGVGRFAVVEFLPDDPYPLAEVDDIEEGAWIVDDAAALAVAEAALRRTYDLASQLNPQAEGAEDGPTFTLADDPALAAWQLCGLAPVGPHDQQRLLVASTTGERLHLLLELVEDLASMLALRLAGG